MSGNRWIIEQVNRWDELKPEVQVALTHLINSMASYNSPSSDAASIDALRDDLDNAYWDSHSAR